MTTPLPIVRFPSPVLKQASIVIPEITDVVRELAAGMVSTMIQADGIGLAAIQVGEPVRMFVTSELLESGKPLVLLNPVIVEASETTRTMDEGCLSIPGLAVPVTRPDRVVVRYLGLDGAEHEVVAADLAASCVQHEIDHLDGNLIIDRLSRLKRTRFETKISKRR